VISPAFKAGDSVLRGSNGGFDSHTLPPSLSGLELQDSLTAKIENTQEGCVCFPSDFLSGYAVAVAVIVL
jgi:hypothetical protein